MGAEKALGFDILDVAISEARQLAEISKLNAKFERTDILESDDKYNNYLTLSIFQKDQFNGF